MENLTFLDNTPAAFRMIYVKGAVFDMGGKTWRDSSLPIHKVQLSDYWIGEFLVTQAIWEQIMKNNPSSFKGENRPVEEVSWDKIVQEFLPALNKQTAKEREEEVFFRLPTEAEWEYAARGGIERKGYVYAGGDKIDEVAWYDSNSHSETKAVGLKLPNELGLYDMSGNVREWCHDWYDKEYYSSCEKEGIIKNPKGPESGAFRVLRGGSWNLTSVLCRSTYRFNYRPDNRINDSGFRLVLSSLPV